MRRGGAWGLVATLVALAGLGCSRPQREPRAASTVPPAAPTTTDPFAVPPVIDVAYVNRVLAELEKVIGDAARVIAARRDQDAAIARLKAVYLEPELSEQMELLNDALAKGLGGLKQAPGDRKADVTRIVSSQANCIFVLAAVDDSALSVKPTEPSSSYYALVPTQANGEQAQYNRTPWAIRYEGFNEDGSEPSNPCIT